jgi:hypothetical protein
MYLYRISPCDNMQTNDTTKDLFITMSCLYLRSLNLDMNQKLQVGTCR